MHLKLSIPKIYCVNTKYCTDIELVRAHSQLKQYEQKFHSRLKAKNLMYVRQILFVLSSLIKCLGGNTDLPADKQHIGKPETKLLTVNNFLFDAKLDNMNLFKVLHYCHKSMISRKLHGFVEKYEIGDVVPVAVAEKDEHSRSGVSKFLQEIQQNRNTAATKENTAAVIVKDPEVTLNFSSPLMHIEGFLKALTNADKDGRIVFTRQALFSQSTLKFLLLNPAVHFASVLTEARAVIVAGGTMQPLSEFKEQLFYAAGVKPERIVEYSCGHVIPSSNLLPMSISCGPSGVELDFTFQSRENPVLLDELGRLIANINNLVPGGVVCFFPSYEYEGKVYAHWEKTGFLNRLSAKKKVFREPKKTTQLDQVLIEYSQCIQKCKSWPGSTLTGAILLSVVGGKMSEGINFSDDLGRCVIMVGLPYPNIKSPELKEKMDYLNANFPRDSANRLPGQVHYENLCMKAVNQSIGRAIRHKDDYATILLLDRRYNRQNVGSKLPKWIGDHLIKLDKFGPAMANIAKFFSEKKETR
ncbi:ATP-dependent DNA helicase DDX11-like [Gigantopelta aegis]|uniref:ATP-dependent DNA helicase DDX11-like n=1 Tax=Gigantopelta aegis TaxID=1735272 RepID=UPI001B88B4DF|nr:ATP-dependent DNA helicase DDX11-like [Gigantopelta aegis]